MSLANQFFFLRSTNNILDTPKTCAIRGGDQRCGRWRFRKRYSKSDRSARELIHEGQWRKCDRANDARRYVTFVPSASRSPIQVVYPRAESQRRVGEKRDSRRGNKQHRKRIPSGTIKNVFGYRSKGFRMLHKDSRIDNPIDRSFTAPRF